MSETRIGPYLIQRLIKSGGQGSVYLGYDRRLNRQVAIKIHALPPGRSARRRVMSEARQVAMINDSRVVQIYDLVEARGYLAVVMEYVPGCDLEDFLHYAGPSISSTLRVGTDLAAALASATHQEVVHGDIKAANVLLTNDGRAKLTDFGLVRPGGGTPGALSPEHVLGQPLDLQSDLFCFGCLLYRMLTGVHPFANRGTSELQALLHLDPVPVEVAARFEETLPVDLVTLVGELLQKDPRQRPTDTHRVRGLLRSALREIPLARADSLLGESRPFFRRESGSDIPPSIPAQLRHGGRSRLVRQGMERWLRRFGQLRRSTQLAVIAMLICGLILVSGLASQRTPVRVHFEPPLFDVAQKFRAGLGLDETWLMQVVLGVVEARIGPLQTSGAVAQRIYHADLADREPREVVTTSLHCSDVLCVLFVARDSASEGYIYQQALIPPQLPRAQWESAVAQAVGALYP